MNSIKKHQKPKQQKHQQRVPPSGCLRPPSCRPCPRRPCPPAIGSPPYSCSTVSNTRTYSCTHGWLSVAVGATAAAQCNIADEPNSCLLPASVPALLPLPSPSSLLLSVCCPSAFPGEMERGSSGETAEKTAGRKKRPSLLLLCAALCARGDVHSHTARLRLGKWER